MTAPAALKGLAVIALAALAVAGSGARASAPATTRVDIRQYAFVPTSVTVATGTTVEWRNGDDDPHTVKSAPDGGD